MTDKNLTEITFIIDRSGSMARIREDVIGGFNSFVEAQHENDGRCNMNLVQFDHECKTVYLGKDLKDVPDLTNRTYVPRGMTALLDAIGRTINTLGQRYSEMPEESRPGAVIVVIQTDGLENASREFNRHEIKEMIEKQSKEYSWDFVFLGANQDAIQEASTLGIRGDAALTYKTHKHSVEATYSALNRRVRTARDFACKSMSLSTPAASAAMSFTQSERNEADK